MMTTFHFNEVDLKDELRSKVKERDYLLSLLLNFVDDGSIVLKVDKLNYEIEIIQDILDEQI